MAYKTLNEGNFYLLDMKDFRVKEQRYEIKNNRYFRIKNFPSRHKALEYIIKYVKGEIKKQQNKIKFAEKRIEKWENELKQLTERNNNK